MKPIKDIDNKPRIGSSLANAVYLGLEDQAQHLSLSNIENGPLKAQVTRNLLARIRQSTFRQIVNKTMQTYGLS